MKKMYVQADSKVERNLDAVDAIREICSEMNQLTKDVQELKKRGYIDQETVSKTWDLYTEFINILDYHKGQKNFLTGKPVDDYRVR